MRLVCYLKRFGPPNIPFNKLSTWKIVDVLVNGLLIQCQIDRKLNQNYMPN